MKTLQPPKGLNGEGEGRTKRRARRWSGVVCVGVGWRGGGGGGGQIGKKKH